ncbi:MAG: Bifunctional protein GlmU [Chlamydiae bacterium]|nr:Bifunctional protein GlmU [Chlamydiota bacterium]
MEKLLLKEFFALDSYSHRPLFDDCQYVWEALGSLEEYLGSIPLGVIECQIPEGVYLINPESISIGKGTIVEPGAYIKGPCVIGADCIVRHGAYIRGSVITGDRCILGHASEFKHSILLDDVCAAHFNYVGDSILGGGVNLGAGVKLANLRLDNECVQVSYLGKKMATSLKKLGAIIGDRAQIGCNVVTNPGTIIGSGAFCHPCLTVSGYVPPGCRVQSISKSVIQDYVDRNSF